MHRMRGKLSHTPEKQQLKSQSSPGFLERMHTRIEFTPHKNVQNTYFPNSSKNIPQSNIEPKSPIDILNSLQLTTVPNITCIVTENGIIATGYMEGKMFHGCGETETVATEKVAEAILKDMFSNLVSTSKQYSHIKSNNISSKDHFPYYNILASLGLYKVLNEWALNTSIGSTDRDISNLPKECISSCKMQSSREENEDLGPNTNHKQVQYDLNMVHKTQIHDEDLMQKDPIVMLNEKAGNLSFVDLNARNNCPPFIMSLYINGLEYRSAPSKSKKEAKQNVASKVLKEEFGYNL